MDQDTGKGRRVLGFFALLLGSGVIVDRGPLEVGLTILALGAALFAWGAAGIIGRARSEWNA